VRAQIPLAVRFAQKFEAHPSGCWIWIGAIMSEGYGAINDGRGRILKAHRVAYELMRGRIPASRNYVDHLCEVRRCVNPAHLKPTTNKENCTRGGGVLMVAYRNGTCLRGHRVAGRNAYRIVGRRPRCVKCTLRQQKDRRERLKA